MRPIGPETATDRARREWIDEQETKILDRLEDGAKTITQLVTSLYGVLFAVLAFDGARIYLQRLSVQVFGTASLLLFFAALLAALATVYPQRMTYQQDNLSQMESVYKAIVRHKSNMLSVALIAFLIGTLCLGGVIISVLWNI